MSTVEYDKNYPFSSKTLSAPILVFEITILGMGAKAVVSQFSVSTGIT